MKSFHEIHALKSREKTYEPYKLNLKAPMTLLFITVQHSLR